MPATTATNKQTSLTCYIPHVIRDSVSDEPKAEKWSSAKQPQQQDKEAPSQGAARHHRITWCWKGPIWSHSPATSRDTHSSVRLLIANGPLLSGSRWGGHPVVSFPCSHSCSDYSSCVGAQERWQWELQVCIAVHSFEKANCKSKV